MNNDYSSTKQGHNKSSNTNSSQKAQFREDLFDKDQKKFGEIIKGEKQQEGSVKLITKLDKAAEMEENMQIERQKIKSYINLDPPSYLNISDSASKDYGRNPSRSFGDISYFNQP